MNETVERDQLLNRIKSAIQEISPNADIILYGSRAMGTASPESDWDLLILLPSTEDKGLDAEIRDRLYDIELETDTVISSIIRSKVEWMSARYEVMPLHQEIERYGVAL